jgi:hypothetical protein
MSDITRHKWSDSDNYYNEKASTKDKIVLNSHYFKAEVVSINASDSLALARHFGQVPEWVSVGDELPKPGKQLYVVCCKVVIEAEYSTIYREFRNSEGRLIRYVTEWMYRQDAIPLPPAPQTQGGEG